MRVRLMRVLATSAISLGAAAPPAVAWAAPHPPAGAAANSANTAPAGVLSVANGLTLTVNGTGRAGSPVTVRTADGRRTQRWKVYRSGRGAAQKITLRPAYNTSLCLTQSGREAAGAQFRVARCRTRSSQRFIGLTNVLPDGQPQGAWPVLITSWDARYCLTVAGGAAPGHHVVLGRCVSALAWSTKLDLSSAMSGHFQEFEPAAAMTSPLAMSVTGAVRSGKKLSLQKAGTSARQIWTDLPPGKSHAGSMLALRPLANLQLCLTVPGGTFKAGVKLRVETCDPKLYQNVVIGQPDWYDFSFLGDGALAVGVSSTSSPAAGLPVTLQQPGLAITQWTCDSSLSHWGQ